MTERPTTVMLSEAVTEAKVMPMGERPKNSPSKPVSPKLRATDSTSSSMMSSLFFPRNNTLTRQYPGIKVMNMKLKM